MPVITTKRLNFPPVRIRDTDLTLLRVLDAAAFADDEPYEDIESDICWIAKVDGIPAGFACLNIMDDKEGFLSRCGVMPKFRGLGIQKKLIETRIKYASLIELQSLVTYTSEDNTYSQNNLKVCGFNIVVPEQLFGLENGIYFHRSIGE